jgi:hypothetical protein
MKLYTYIIALFLIFFTSCGSNEKNSIECSLEVYSEKIIFDFKNLQCDTFIVYDYKQKKIISSKFSKDDIEDVDILSRIGNVVVFMIYYHDFIQKDFFLKTDHFKYVKSRSFSVPLLEYGVDNGVLYLKKMEYFYDWKYDEKGHEMFGDSIVSILSYYKNYEHNIVVVTVITKDIDDCFDYSEKQIILNSINVKKY